MSDTTIETGLPLKHYGQPEITRRIECRSERIQNR